LLYTLAVKKKIAEIAFNDVFSHLDYAIKKTSDSAAQNPDVNGCVTITVTPFDTVSWPKTITIDYGSITFCTCDDNNFRRGKIIAMLSGKYTDSATVITITLDQYYVNDKHIEGSEIITNMGHIGVYGANKNTVYKIDVTNAKITTADGLIKWNSTHSREWIEGENTLWPLYTDDAYLVTGTANGTDINNNNFTAEIIDPLHLSLDCRWIKEGALEITPQGLTVRTVDFGNGDCDEIASVIVNAITIPFSMK